MASFSSLETSLVRLACPSILSSRITFTIGTPSSDPMEDTSWIELAFLVDMLCLRKSTRIPSECLSMPGKISRLFFRLVRSGVREWGELGTWGWGWLETWVKEGFAEAAVAKEVDVDVAAKTEGE